MLNNAIVITGAGQRIGLYLAKQFLTLTDYPVVFSYRTHRVGVDELLALGAIGIQVDFTEANSIESFFNKLTAQVSSIRGVIHNASVWAKDAQIENDASLFDAMLKLHIEVPYRLNNQLKPLMDRCDQPLKDIISITDSTVANDTHIAYSASKAGLQDMTKNFAKKYAPEIKVNSIAPGLILFNEDDSESYKKRRLAQSAIRIEPGADVIWQTVQYLMKSPYITGETIVVDGGKKLI